MGVQTHFCFQPNSVEVVFRLTGNQLELTNHLYVSPGSAWEQVDGKLKWVSSGSFGNVFSGTLGVFVSYEFCKSEGRYLWM